MPRPKKTTQKRSAEQIAVETVERQPNPYRDEMGVRRQYYKRHKEGIDYQPIEGQEMVAMMKAARDSIIQLRRTGRPPKFETKEELQEAIIGYFEYLIKANENGARLIVDWEGLGSYIGVSRETLNQWERNNSNGFSDTLKVVRNHIAASKKQLALNGKIPPIVFATDFNNNHGYVQKQEVAVTPVNPLGEEPDQKALEEKLADVVIDDPTVDDAT